MVSTSTQTFFEFLVAFEILEIYGRDKGIWREIVSLIQVAYLVAHHMLDCIHQLSKLKRDKHNKLHDSVLSLSSFNKRIISILDKEETSLCKDTMHQHLQTQIPVLAIHETNITCVIQISYAQSAFSVPRLHYI